MAEKNAEQIKVFYTELSKLAPSEDWQSILKVAKKILGLSINDKKAFHCKIVCLIHLNKFDEALTSIERFNAETNDFYFEKAYCEYRLNKIDNAYKTLKNCPNSTTKEKELLAQVTYRLENYQESYDTYCDIVKTTQDDYDIERQTNLSAVVCALNNTNKNKATTKDLDMTEYENKTYELCYNSACILLSKGKYKEAEAKLKKAETMCKTSFETDEELTEAELENEISIIRVQLAYCLQKLEKCDEANKIYNTVLKNKPDDLSVIAVASNNIVTLNKDQNVFDSKKRIKAASANELEFKLNSSQRSTIAFNEILLSIIANQNDLVNKLLKQFEIKFNDTLKLVLLKLSQFYKDKRFNDAENVLNEFLNVNKNESIIKYYLMQVLLIQGKFNETVNLIKTIDSYQNYPALISALVVLFNNLNKKIEISNLFNQTIDYLNKTNPNSKQIQVYLKENADYQIKIGNPEKAVEMLEQIRKTRPNDQKILSQLINTYSKFDSEKAKLLSVELPTLEDFVKNSTIDFDSLESQFSLLSSKYLKTKGAKDSEAKSASSPASSKASKTSSTKTSSSATKTSKQGSTANSSSIVAASSPTDLIQKKKSNKKKKIKLPKNFDPTKPLDAERWLPLRERSYYRGRRRKKTQNTIGKGTQGAVSSEQQQQSPTASPISSPQQLKQQVNTETKLPANIAAAKSKASAHKNKNKKKGGSKW